MTIYEEIQEILLGVISISKRQNRYQAKDLHATFGINRERRPGKNTIENLNQTSGVCLATQQNKE